MDIASASVTLFSFVNGMHLPIGQRLQMLKKKLKVLKCFII
jgi:hypothetical protein